jgi:hypothetical protein
MQNKRNLILIYTGVASVDFIVNTYKGGYNKLTEYRNSQEYTYVEEKDKITDDIYINIVPNLICSAVFPLIWFEKIVIKII